MFKAIRILLLLCVLIFVGLSAYTLDVNLRDWSKTKWVVIYPINGDGSKAASKYIANLKDTDFDAMRSFLNREASDYGVTLNETFKISLGPVLNNLPPTSPQHGAWYENAWWSLQLRFWASKIEDTLDGPPADIKIFVEYYDPAKFSVLPHSVGMKKLSLAVVKGFASRKMTQSNNIVMSHELLHVFGATDKYETSSTLPVYPEGYAEPDRKPLYPQRKAEIMGGRIPESETKAKIPTRFKYVMVGPLTAKEIGWTQ